MVPPNFSATQYWLRLFGRSLLGVLPFTWLTWHNIDHKMVTDFGGFLIKEYANYGLYIGAGGMGRDGRWKVATATVKDNRQSLEWS